MKDFTIKSVAQDSNGRYMIMAKSEDGDVFTLNAADRGDLEIGHVVEVEMDNRSTYAPPAPPAPKEEE